MEGEKTICVVCACRGSCNKKFSYNGVMTCTEYTKDVLFKDAQVRKREDVSLPKPEEKEK
jgi:hypothetical protein